MDQYFPNFSHFFLIFKTIMNNNKKYTPISYSADNITEQSHVLVPKNMISCFWILFFSSNYPGYKIAFYNKYNQNNIELAVSCLYHHLHPKC